MDRHVERRRQRGCQTSEAECDGGQGQDQGNGSGQASGHGGMVAPGQGQTKTHAFDSPVPHQGVPMAVIAAALGHVDTRMTERHYAALAPSYIADMIRSNLPKLGLVEPDKIVGLPRRSKGAQQKSV